jgi:hypothetical protein
MNQHMLGKLKEGGLFIPKETRYLWRRDYVCFECGHSGYQPDTQIPKYLHLIAFEQLVKERLNLLYFLFCGLGEVL